MLFGPPASAGSEGSPGRPVTDLLDDGSRYSVPDEWVSFCVSSSGLLKFLLPIRFGPGRGTPFTSSTRGRCILDIHVDDGHEPPLILLSQVGSDGGGCLSVPQGCRDHATASGQEALRRLVYPSDGNLSYMVREAKPVSVDAVMTFRVAGCHLYLLLPFRRIT